MDQHIYKGGDMDAVHFQLSSTHIVPDRDSFAQAIDSEYFPRP